MKRSYLILTYFYTPMISARAFRWRALAEHWTTQGYHVDVISGLEGDLLPEEQINGVNVFRVNNAFYETIRRRFVRSHASMVKTETPHISPSRWIVKAARWAYYDLWVNLYWPDGGCLWYGPALRKAKQLAAEHRYDVLISVSPFFTAHLVGEYINQATNPPCWLVDYGDPFALQEVEPHNNIRLYKNLNSTVERRILNSAGAIAVTTNLTKDLYVSHFPQCADKIAVIPPLLSTPQSVHPDTPRLSDGRVRLLYAGALYSETRSPDFLLKLLSGLLQQSEWDERLELHLYGDVSRVRESFKPYRQYIDRGSITLHGTVDRNMVARVMEEADILVNIGNKTAYQLPSKVIEYASTGKPILNLMQVDNDSSKEVYETYSGVLNLLEQGDAVLNTQIDILGHWISNLPARADQSFLNMWLARYRLDVIARAYDKLIERLLEPHSSIIEVTQ